MNIRVIACFCVAIAQFYSFDWMCKRGAAGAAAPPSVDAAERSWLTVLGCFVSFSTRGSQ
jgi:hypothetical protein